MSMGPRTALSLALFTLLSMDVAAAADGDSSGGPHGKAARIANGQVLFDYWCLPCHEAGEGHPGTMALEARLGADQSVLLRRSELTQEYVVFVIRNGLQMMPPFRPTEISDQDATDIWLYIDGHGGHDASGEMSGK